MAIRMEMIVFFCFSGFLWLNWRHSKISKIQDQSEIYASHEYALGAKVLWGKRTIGKDILDKVSFAKDGYLGDHKSVTGSTLCPPLSSTYFMDLNPNIRNGPFLPHPNPLASSTETQLKVLVEYILKSLLRMLRG